jgi:two-component system response regulator GlrR
MLPRVLFLDGVPRLIDRNFISSLPIRAEFADWSSSDIVSLGRPDLDLLVAVAAPESRNASIFFESLTVKPPCHPTLAVFAQNSEFIGTASRWVDDFVVAPVREADLQHRISRILGEKTPQADERAAHDNLSAEMGLANFVGAHPAFVQVLKQVGLAARSNCSVIISGETGTGKELCARALHHLSPRRHRPFIPVDCAGFPEHLFENEMFGHARGAFTDAHRDQKGLVDLAAGGTLFLDEIDSLSAAAQAKLLRFIQERTYRPIGSARFLTADVRILAATNRDLEALARDGKFRSDLLFRLNVVKLQMVPLRERRSDIPLLVQHFLSLLATENRAARKSLSAAAIRRLMQHDWPGNVRELYNVIQRADALSPGRQIQVESLGDGIAADLMPERPITNFREARARTLEDFERAFVQDALRKTNGNITRAARLVQKDRRVFGRLMKRYNIRRDDI